MPSRSAYAPRYLTLTDWPPKKRERENENEKSSSVHCHSCRMWSNSHVALNSIFPLVFRKLKSNNSGWKQTTRNKQPKRCKRGNKKNPNDKPNRFKTSDTTADYRKRKKWWKWVDAPLLKIDAIKLHTFNKIYEIPEHDNDYAERLRQLHIN